MISPVRAELKDWQVSGNLEVEAAYSSSEADGDSSDLVVPTVEIGLSSSLSSQLSISLTLLAEDTGDGGGDVNVDEAVIVFNAAPSMITLGQTTLPFGRYEMGTISDPLTLLLGETTASTLIYSFEQETGFAVSAYLFNGDSEESSTDSLSDIGFSLSLTRESWSIGMDVIGNLGNSDSLVEIGNNVNKTIPGLALHLAYSVDSLSFFIEHVTALDDFTAGDLGGVVTSSMKPRATHVEVGLELENERSISLSLSGTRQAEGLLDPDYETQAALGYNMPLIKDAQLSIEWLEAKQYGGSRDTILSALLSVDF